MIQVEPTFPDGSKLITDPRPDPLSPGPVRPSSAATPEEADP